jgi:hypothetical protein
MERETILKEARRWVGYTESNYCDYLEYESQQGGHGKNNYNRFSWIFDKMLSPKVYAGGNKDGYAWCATFVATTIGVCDFVEKNHLVHEIVSAPIAMRAEMRRCYCSNLDIALGLKGTPLASASMLAGVSSYPRFTDIQQTTYDQAKPADLIIFGDNAHIGFVEAIGEGKIVTIEGNTKCGSPTPNGGEVCRKLYVVNGVGLIELRNGARLKSWDRFKLFKIKAK